jgi:hypothetical protein
LFQTGTTDDARPFGIILSPPQVRRICNADFDEVHIRGNAADVAVEPSIRVGAARRRFAHSIYEN